MLKHDGGGPLLYVVLGAMCFSFSSSDRPSFAQKPGISDEASHSQPYGNPATVRKEMADLDEPPEEIHQGVKRMGDWNDRENWRYDRKAFFKGETQGEAYEEEHRYGPEGIGYDGDADYLQIQKFYREEAERNHPQRSSN